MEFNSQYSLETILNYQRDSLSLLNKYYTGKLIIAYFPTMKKEYKNLFAFLLIIGLVTMFYIIYGF